MSLLSRYQNGETVSVFSDIERLGTAAFEQKNFDEINAVLEETFERVAYNIEVIYAELKSLGYIFWKGAKGNDETLVRPTPDVLSIIEHIEQEIASIGSLPLSLKYFYKIVGSCNLAWNYEDSPDIIWELADPLQVAPLAQVLEEVRSSDWLEIASETIVDGDLPILELAADCLHKDNISGGPPYGIEINQQPCIDSKFIDGLTDVGFIQYLRTCFEYGGFPGFAQREAPQSFLEYKQKIRPLLRPI